MADFLIPQLITQCRAYHDNARLISTGELTLPNLTRPTVEVNGAGMAGPAAIPVQGSLESMQASFASRVLTPEMVAAFAPGVHSLEFRGIAQTLNAGGDITELRVSVFMRVMAHGITQGTMSNGAEMASVADFEVLDEYLKINDVLLVDFSKMNGILKIRNAEGKLVDENATAQAFLGG